MHCDRREKPGQNFGKSWGSWGGAAVAAGWWRGTPGLALQLLGFGCCWGAGGTEGFQDLIRNVEAVFEEDLAIEGLGDVL